MEDITAADYSHAKRVCKYFEIKNLEEYYDLYVQSGKLLLVDVFENFRNMCQTWSCKTLFSSRIPGLAWEAALKNTKLKLDLLTGVLSWWIMWFLEKLWKMWEKIEI